MQYQYSTIEDNIGYIISQRFPSKKSKPSSSKIITINSGTEAQAYLIKTSPEDLILKVLPRKKLEETKYETEIIRTLNSTSDNFIILESEPFILNNDIAVLYKYFDGKSLRKQSLTRKNISQIAKMQAEMHRILVDFKPTNSERKRFSIFDFSFVDIFQTNLSDDTRELVNEAKDVILEKLSPFKLYPLPQSIIHEDLEMVNILENKTGKLMFIDFGESHRAPIISDIATTLKEIIANPIGLNTRLFYTYLGAYQNSNPILDQIQLDMLYLLILRRTLFMFTYLLHKGDEIDSKNNKGYSCNIDLEKKLLKELLNTRNLTFNFEDMLKYER